jgi:hypothetical protein
MRLSILQKLADWFKNLSFSRKIVLTVFMALLILSTPILYQRTTWLIKSKACSMSGGELTHAGMEAKLMCIHPYPDGGKPCSSSKECIGGCVIYEPPVQGQPTPSVGVCRFSHPEFGCDAPIENPDFFACP